MVVEVAWADRQRRINGRLSDLSRQAYFFSQT